MNDIRKPLTTSGRLPSAPRRLPHARVTFIALLPVVAAGLCGCQVLTYSGPNGERFSRHSVGSTTSLSLLVIETATNGLRRVELRGYRADSAQALGTVTEAAVRAAITSAK